MKSSSFQGRLAAAAISLAVLLLFSAALGQPRSPTNHPTDAVEEAQTPREVPVKRPEQQKNAHDRDAALFQPGAAPDSAPGLAEQPDRGRLLGFDFYRDPLNAKRPMQSPDEIRRQDEADKPKVMAAQRALLESRYDLTPRLDPEAKMSRGKPLAVGPTARLRNGLTFERLAEMSPPEIKKQGLFPYPALPHPKQGGGLGGQVFPKMQIDMFPRLQRFDVDFDIPDAFLPEFPPAIYLQSRPELGDVSRGEVVSINNYYRLFKDILTPVQLDLDPKLATESELRGERLFFGKAACASCHLPPVFLDNEMHDLHLERFTNDAPLGPMKTFTLRGIKDSPPYLHDGRCLTLEDTVELFNLVQGLKLTPEEKKDLVAYLRQL